MPSASAVVWNDPRRRESEHRTPPVWLIDELSYAGQENLDDDQAAWYGSKDGIFASYVLRAA